MVESNTVVHVSAYSMYRNLQHYCSNPPIYLYLDLPKRAVP